MSDQKPIGTVYRCPVGPHEFTRPGHDPSNDARCETHWGYMGARVRFEYQTPFASPQVVLTVSPPTVVSAAPAVDVVTLGHPAEGIFEAPVAQVPPEPNAIPASFERFDALLAKVDESLAHTKEVIEAPPVPLPPSPLPTPPEEPKPPSPRTRRRPG